LSRNAAGVLGVGVEWCVAETSVDTRMGERLALRIARVDAALATPWWQARLGGRFDAYFEAITAPVNAQVFKFWIVALAAVQLLGLLRDVGFGMQSAGLVLRGLVALPVLFVIGLLLAKPVSRHRVAWLTSAAVLTAIGVQILLAVIAAQPYADRYLMGAVFAFSILHLVMPFTYRQVVAHAAIVGSVVGLTAWACKGDGDTSVMDSLEVLLPAMIVVAAAGALRMRHGRRRAVLMDLRSTLQAEALEFANRSLARLLRQDTLTGVFNRRHFDETMEQLWVTSKSAGRPLGLILIDVDHFKNFNDREGHQAGDACLKEVARCLAGSLRESDFVVARYGGEEFAVVLPGTNAVEAFAIGERLRKSVESLALPHPTTGIVTVSVGTTACVPDARDRHYSLVDAADTALYASKEAGRNCVTASFIASEQEKRFSPPTAQAA
jgi:diguanylate cyclase (GGDEF)-like protein